MQAWILVTGPGLRCVADLARFLEVAEQSLAPVEVELLPRCGATYLTVPALIRGQLNSGATG